MTTHIPDPSDQVRVFAHQRDSGQIVTRNLIGLTYPDVLHRMITIVSKDPIKGPDYYLVERRDDGAQWGVEAKLLERLFPLEIEPEEVENVSP